MQEQAGKELILTILEKELEGHTLNINMMVIRVMALFTFWNRLIFLYFPFQLQRSRATSMKMNKGIFILETKNKKRQKEKKKHPMSPVGGASAQCLLFLSSHGPGLMVKEGGVCSDTQRTLYLFAHGVDAIGPQERHRLLHQVCPPTVQHPETQVLLKLGFDGHCVQLPRSEKAVVSPKEGRDGQQLPQRLPCKTAKS